MRNNHCSEKKRKVAWICKERKGFINDDTGADSIRGSKKKLKKTKANGQNYREDKYVNTKRKTGEIRALLNENEGTAPMMVAAL